MPAIKEIIDILEAFAPPAYQEHYDNSGLLTGDREQPCNGILCTLDATAAVVKEAREKGANLIVAHHPLIFGGIRSIRPDHHVGKALIEAIKNDIAIYAIHTNLDNIAGGVSGMMARKLGLINTRVLSPAKNVLSKLQFFVPVDHLQTVQDAVFAVGGGHIGNYSECSFTVLGEGSFKAEERADPFLGEKGQRHIEKEYKVELIFPNPLMNKLVAALRKAHPYEEVAFDILPLSNFSNELGSGILGELPMAVPVADFLQLVAETFRMPVIRFTETENKSIKKLALCGGSGSFLTEKARQAGADAFISADFKYHEFFESGNNLMICDIGHFESEQFTSELLHEVLVEKFPTFAVLKSEIETSPVRYFKA